MDAKRAVDAATILQSRIASTIVFIMAAIAHRVSSEASEKGYITAIHAFPVYVIFTVYSAIVKTISHINSETVLADEVFFLCISLGCISSFLLAVNESSEVRLFASMALIKGAAMISKFLWLPVIGVMGILESLIV